MILDRVKAWVYERLAIRQGDRARVNPSGHGWTKPVSAPREADRPTGIPTR